MTEVAYRFLFEAGGVAPLVALAKSFTQHHSKMKLVNRVKGKFCPARRVVLPGAMSSYEPATSGMPIYFMNMVWARSLERDCCSVARVAVSSNARIGCWICRAAGRRQGSEWWLLDRYQTFVR